MNMWIRGMVAATLVGSFGIFAGATSAEEKSAKAELKCPVSDKPCDGSVTAEWQGKKVQLCCPGCEGVLAKADAKVAAKVVHQLVLTKQAKQVACPLSGGKLNADTAVDVDGASVAFCCDKCEAKAKAATDKVAFAFGTGKGFTLQTVCPVSGKEIAATASVDHNGKKVYFCCGNCVKAFEADPAKFEKAAK